MNSPRVGRLGRGVRVHQLLDPGQPLLLLHLGRPQALVEPVRGDPELGLVVHLARATWISSGRPSGPITVVCSER